MENDLITKDHETVKSFFLSLEKMLDGIENLVKNCKPSLNGKRYLTDLWKEKIRHAFSRKYTFRKKKIFGKTVLGLAVFFLGIYLCEQDEKVNSGTLYFLH